MFHYLFFINSLPLRGNYFFNKIKCFSLKLRTRKQKRRPVENASQRRSECRKLSKSSKGLVLSAGRRTTLKRFAWFPTESGEAYFRLDFLRNFLIMQKVVKENNRCVPTARRFYLEFCFYQYFAPNGAITFSTKSNAFFA
jgi:hypothetical protein